MRRSSLLHPDYIRSILFGVEDALVSTTGVVVGVSVGSAQRQIVILASLVTIAVEALSMGAGQYLSERTVHQMKGKRHTDNLLVGAGLMFASYALAGCLPVLPLFFVSYPLSPILSVILAFIGLFTLGFIKGKVTGKPFRSGMEILIIGGLATFIGIVVGAFLKTME